jgi:hypothetical protein
MEARKQVAELKAEKEKLGNGTPTEDNNGTEEKNQNESALKFGVDLDDPEVERAVTVIQAGYRGMEARKQVAEMKAEKEKSDTETATDANSTCVEESSELRFAVDLEDPEVEKAVTVIQAGYRGMEARKQVAEMKAEKGLVETNTGNSAPVEGEKQVAEIVDDSGAGANPDQLEQPSGDPDSQEHHAGIDYNDPEVVEAITIIQLGFQTILQRQNTANVNSADSAGANNNNSLVLDPEEAGGPENRAPSPDNASLKLDFENPDTCDLQQSAEKDHPSDQAEQDGPEGEAEDETQAAIKIQARVRGHQTRRELREKFGQKSSAHVEEQDDDEPADGVIRVRSVEQAAAPDEEAALHAAAPEDEAAVHAAAADDVDGAAALPEAACDDDAVSDDDESTQFSTSEAQRNVAIRAKKSPFAFIKKMISGMSGSTAGSLRRNKVFIS